MSKTTDRTTAELRALLANYEQRMIDSSDQLTLPTARLMSAKMTELHNEIKRRESEKQMATAEWDAQFDHSGDIGGSYDPE